MGRTLAFIGVALAIAFALGLGGCEQARAQFDDARHSVSSWGGDDDADDYDDERPRKRKKRNYKDNEYRHGSVVVGGDDYRDKRGPSPFAKFMERLGKDDD